MITLVKLLGKKKTITTLKNKLFKVLELRNSNRNLY